MKAKNFSLPDKNGKIFNLFDFVGKWVVLYFYPRDNTPGCTVEALGFRDNLKEFKKRNAVIIGVSKDSQKSHQNFCEKYDLNFLLLSDDKKEAIKRYSAWGKKKFMGREFEGVLRMTYLINPKGNIKKIYEKVNTAKHVKEILNDLDEFVKSNPTD